MNKLRAYFTWKNACYRSIQNLSLPASYIKIFCVCETWPPSSGLSPNDRCSKHLWNISQLPRRVSLYSSPWQLTKTTLTYVHTLICTYLSKGDSVGTYLTATIRTDIDDVAPSSLHHSGQHGRHAVQSAFHIDVNHLLPFLNMHILHHSVVQNTSIIHQDVQRSQHGLCALHADMHLQHTTVLFCYIYPVYIQGKQKTTLQEWWEILE